MKTEQLSHYNTPRLTVGNTLVLLCDRVNSPANAGSLFRLADALGITHLYFINTCPDLNSNRLKRTARGCEKSVAFSTIDDATTLLKALKQEHYTLVGLELTTQSTALHTFKQTAEKIALVVGNEKEGISPSILAKLDCTLHIPMSGQNSSMNVSQATAIAVYQLLNPYNHG